MIALVTRIRDSFLGTGPWKESCEAGPPVPRGEQCQTVDCHSVRVTTLKRGERGTVSCLEEPWTRDAATLAALGLLPGVRVHHTPEALLEELGGLLWEHAGILRDEAGLREGLERLGELRAQTADLRVDGDRTSRSFEYAVDLSVSLTVAEALLRTALERTESRGAHYRTDHPETASDWRVNLVVSVDDGGFSIRRRGIGEVSEPVREALEEGYELDYHHLE